MKSARFFHCPKNDSYFSDFLSAMIEAKLAKISIVIVIVFLLCWAPYVVTRSLEFVGLSLSSAIMSGGAWSVHVSSFVNPIIYSSLRADLRKSMFRVFYREVRTVPSTTTGIGTVGCTGSDDTHSGLKRQRQSLTGIRHPN